MRTTELYREGYGDIWDIPGARKAYDFVQQQLAIWASVPGRIRAALDKSAALSAIAQRQGKPALGGKAAESTRALTTLSNVWQTANEKLTGALKELKAAGFGIVPLIVAGAIIAAAGVMLYVFKNLEYNERVLSDIEKGLLPSTALQPGGSTFGGNIGAAVGDVVKYAALAGVAYVGYRAYRARRRRA